ncbi:unnamed protein product [Arctia plantaginis]|uniref:Uncharacterized protein n=1 Tax=Arctia plantaginis TaxID=874455 RepID=A0A8S1BHL8_ARCPL|nr:unnamed protein product [Arctia plantaginis]
MCCDIVLYLLLKYKPRLLSSRQQFASQRSADHRPSLSRTTLTNQADQMVYAYLLVGGVVTFSIYWLTKYILIQESEMEIYSTTTTTPVPTTPVPTTTMFPMPPPLLYVSNVPKSA